MRNFKSLRHAKQLSQKDLSTRLDVGYTTVQKFENDMSYNPSWDTIVLFADFFGVSADYLMGRNTDSSKIESENKLISNLTKEELETAYDFILRMRELYTQK